MACELQPLSAVNALLAIVQAWPKQTSLQKHVTAIECAHSKPDLNQHAAIDDSYVAVACAM